MQKLTSVGENLVQQVSSRYGLSHDAIVHMLVAVNNGNGAMAQFNCPELGGSGQWMRGGMTMVGDMFNHGLKATVDSLCLELSEILASHQVFPIIPTGTPGSNRWWPANLGQPLSSGAQNNIRYAIFPGRLVIEKEGDVSIYDTLNHNIGGVSQQQGSGTSLSFSSQFGTIAVDSLPIISGPAMKPSPQVNFAAPEPEEQSQQPLPVNSASQTEPERKAPPLSAPENPTSESMERHQDLNQILDLIARLAQLRDQGAITEEEYNAKKSELLARI